MTNINFIFSSSETEKDFSLIILVGVKGKNAITFEQITKFKKGEKESNIQNFQEGSVVLSEGSVVLFTSETCNNCQLKVNKDGKVLILSMRSKV